MPTTVLLTPTDFQTFQHPCLGFSAEINSEEWPLGSLWVTPAAAIVKMQNCLLPKCKWEERVPYNNNQLVRHRRLFCCCLLLLFVIICCCLLLFDSQDAKFGVEGWTWTMSVYPDFCKNKKIIQKGFSKFRFVWWLQSKVFLFCSYVFVLKVGPWFLGLSNGGVWAFPSEPSGSRPICYWLYWHSTRDLKACVRGG